MMKRHRRVPLQQSSAFNQISRRVGSTETSARFILGYVVRKRHPSLIGRMKVGAYAPVYQCAFDASIGFRTEDALRFSASSHTWQQPKRLLLPLRPPRWRWSRILRRCLQFPEQARRTPPPYSMRSGRSQRTQCALRHRT